MKDNARENLINAIKNGLREVITLLDDLSSSLSSVATNLRFQQDKETLNSFANSLKDLESIYKFAEEVQNGLSQLNSMGYTVGTHYLDVWAKSEEHLRNMLNSFESEDWVTVCDLIEYEIIPIISRGKTSFQELFDYLSSH